MLWDIDGTLLNSHGAGVRALQRALFDGFGIDGAIEDIDYSGRTDGWIIRQILAKFNLPSTPENRRRMADGYIAALPAEVAAGGVQLLAGVTALLEASVARGDVALGLLTGNLRRGAEVKLASRDAWRYFPFGAFADDSEDRDQLGPRALDRARVYHGVDFFLGNVWVIGDTPHDVRCARAFGARAVAVATGHHARALLEAADPDAVLDDLGDASAFWRAVDGADCGPR